MTIRRVTTVIISASAGTSIWRLWTGARRSPGNIIRRARSIFHQRIRLQTDLAAGARTANGKLVDFKNEYLSLRDYLTKEEIAGRDEEIIFDPFLKEILKTRKEQSGNFRYHRNHSGKAIRYHNQARARQLYFAGCAGSGKTMIMLHRLSYLMYNNEKLRPRDVLVITPSDSFNDFIDELATILELEKVKTKTIDEYFYPTLQNSGHRHCGQDRS